jgi:hypothetical protein
MDELQKLPQKLMEANMEFVILKIIDNVKNGLSIDESVLTDEEKLLDISENMQNIVLLLEMNL